MRCDLIHIATYNLYIYTHADWKSELNEATEQLLFYKLSSTCAPCTGVAISFSLIICSNFDWHLHYAGEAINTKECPLFTDSPSKLCSITHKEKIVKILDHSKVCIGNPDKKFHALSERRQGVWFFCNKLNYNVMHICN